MKLTELTYRLLHVALGILRDNGGAMRLSELLRAVEEKEGDKIAPEHREKYPDGSPKWQKYFRFYSIQFVKSGLLKKGGGRWHLTPEGEAASRRQLRQVSAKVGKTFREWWQGQRGGAKERAEPLVQAGDEEDVDKEVGEAPDVSLDASEGQARDGIVEHIRKMAPGDLEKLVAALLRGMSYHTPIVASGGPDGGVDVLAYRDPLGATSPRLKVQVKHRIQSTQKSTLSELQALNGLLTEGEVGVFVATAGFTASARNFVRAANNHLETIDMDRLIDLWREHYDALSDEDKALLPLRRIAFLDRERIGNI